MRSAALTLQCTYVATVDEMFAPNVLKRIAGSASNAIIREIRVLRRKCFGHPILCL